MTGFAYCTRDLDTTGPMLILKKIKKAVHYIKHSSFVRRRLQNSPYFCVFKYVRVVKQKVWNEAENRRVRLAPFARARLLRRALPISLLILGKKTTVLQSM